MPERRWFVNRREGVPAIALTVFHHLGVNVVGGAGLVEKEPEVTKVLFCLAELSLSGAPWSCFHLARAVRQRDFSPALLVARAGPLEKVFREEGIPVHALRKSHWGFGPAQRYRKALDAAFQAVQPDLIHINNVFELGATVAQFDRSRGVPVLWHVRENPEETRTLRLWPLIRSLSDFVVVNCDDSRRRLLPRAGSTPVASVANGLDEEFFFANRSASRPLRERFDIPENAQMVGTVGHVKSRKGTFVFVRAAARVLQRRKDARFLICGRAATGRGRDARYFQAIEEFVSSR